MKQLNEKEILSYFDEAIFNNQICAYYQPKFNHSTGRIIGAEALMRWIHPVYDLQLYSIHSCHCRRDNVCRSL